MTKMPCRKCGSRNTYSNGCGESNGFYWETWYCPDCGYSHTINTKVVKKSKSITQELPDELVINGVKYRRV